MRSIVEKVGFDEILECDTGHLTWKSISKYEPKIAIISSNIEGLNIRSIAERVERVKSNTRILAVVKKEDYMEADAISKCGVAGVISQELSACDIAKAIATVSDGGTYSCPFLLNETVIQQDAEVQTSRLSSRELEILKCVARGDANKKISYKLSISVRTVEAHRRNIRLKTNITTIPEQTLLAQKLGLLDF